MDEDRAQLVTDGEARRSQRTEDVKNAISAETRNRSSRSGTKKMTILHSNDIHGDFGPKQADGRQVGGLSLLSGYVQMCREEGENVLYAIAGDLFRGSILESDTSGLSTIYLMNAMSPDVVTLGNHEVDYGIEHLLFLEKCAYFPIVNANMVIRMPVNDKRMYPSWLVLERNSVRVLFIGLLTEETNRQVATDLMVGKHIKVNNPAKELKNLYETNQVPKADITILLTHIGLSEDIALAKTLDPAWGIDLIIGGHSHELTQEPVVENGVTIVQVGSGSGKLGRFDLVYDFTENRITSCRWQIIPVNSDTCPRDSLIDEALMLSAEKVGEINSEVITTLNRELTHPNRGEETELGDLYADCYKDGAQADLALISSGSIRTERLGPKVTLGDLKVNYPYTDDGYLLYMTGGELRRALRHILDRFWNPEETGPLYQVSEGVRVDYDCRNGELIRFDLNGEPLKENQVYSAAVEQFLYSNMKERFGFSPEELTHSDRTGNLSSVQGIIRTVLKNSENLEKVGKGRLNFYNCAM